MRQYRLHEELDGVWHSLGWGSCTRFAEAVCRLLKTSRTCVLAFKAERQRLAGATDPTFVEMEQISALPAVCTPPTPDTPLGNFDVFAHTFAEHYASFG